MQIFYETVMALVQARRVRHGNADAGVDLPPVRPDMALSSATALSVAKRISVFVKALLFWKLGQCCFYRCYAVACVLRRRGVPVVLNIGLLEPADRSRVFGHCWLSLNGEPFAERRDPHVLYPVEMGSRQEGVAHWLGSRIGKH